MEIYLVMGNDYPSAIFTNKEEAEKFCEEKKEEDKDTRTGSPRNIYWRVYKFTLDSREEGFRI